MKKERQPIKGVLAHSFYLEPLRPLLLGHCLLETVEYASGWSTGGVRSWAVHFPTLSLCVGLSWSSGSSALVAEKPTDRESRFLEQASLCAWELTAQGTWRDKACLLRGNGNGGKWSASKHCDSVKLWALTPLSICISSVIVWQRGAHKQGVGCSICPSRSTLYSFQPALIPQAGHSELYCGCFAPGPWMESGIGRLTMRAACLFLQADPCLCCPPGSNSLLGDLLLWPQQLSRCSLLLPFAPSG